MNYFFKTALTGACFMVTMAVNAQDLAKKIPANALAVATVKGHNLLELMSVSEFNNSFIGQKVLAKLSEKGTTKYNSIENFGLNTTANFYYYNLTNDSVSYNCLLAPVKDATKFDQYLIQSGKKFQVNGKQRVYFNADSTESIKWNDEMLLCVIPIGRADYFNNVENRKRFGMSEQPVQVAVDSATVVTDAVDVIAPYNEQEIGDAAKPAVKKDIKKKKGKGSKGPVKTNKNIRSKGKKTGKKPYKRKVEPAIDTDEVAVDSAVVYEDEINPFFQDEKIKKTVVARWASKMTDDFFTEQNKTSILDNKDFAKSIDQKAEATVWISGAEKLMNSFMPLASLKGMNLLSGYGSANAKLFLENDVVKISSAMTFGDELAGTIKKINARKLNPQFLKYVNEDHLIGYLSYAMDTKAYLQEYPKMFSKMAGSNFSDEIGMAADLFSLILDEEAISKVVKGDGMFIFNGLSQKEVSYKSFEYNEDNFETKEVTKTKMETLPDFLFMFSSEDQRLINKLIAYGVKKEVVKSTQGYYELSVPKSPMAIYLAIKNGIVFIGSNGSELKQIVANTYKAKVSAKHKKALLGGNTAAYFSPKKMAGKIPAGELGSAKSVARISKTMNSLGDVYLRTFPMSGNTFSAEISMDIPANQKNALKYLFAVVEDAQQK